MTLATLAVVGLQGYIWQQSITEERERFSDRVQNAVFSATEALLEPSSSSVVFVDRTPFRIRRDSLRRTGTFQVRLLDSNGEAFADTLGRIAVDSLAGTIVNMTRNIARLPADTVLSTFTFRDSTATVSGVLNEFHYLAFPDSIAHIRVGHYVPERSPVLSMLTNSLRPILTAHLAQQGVEADFAWGIQQTQTGEWLAVEGDTAAVQKARWQFPMFVFAFDENANTFRSGHTFRTRLAISRAKRMRFSNSPP